MKTIYTKKLNLTPVQRVYLPKNSQILGCGVHNNEPSLFLLGDPNDFFEDHRILTYTYYDDVKEGPLKYIGMINNSFVFLKQKVELECEP